MPFYGCFKRESFGNKSLLCYYSYCISGSCSDGLEENIMQIPEKERKIDFRPFLSFVATALLLTVTFAYFGIFPFGPHDLTATESGGVFSSVLTAFRNHLLNGRSLTYSFRIGMGKSLASVFAFYLSSPLNLLALLFPVERMSEAVMVILSLKISLAGAFMTWFLDRKFRDKTKMSILFGAIYAMSPFSLSFLTQSMWLDGFLLLPLVLVETEEFRKDTKRWWRLLIVITILFASGYYMAYIVGVFTLIYLVALLDYEGAFEKGRIPSGENVTGLFLLSVLFAAMILAVIWVPAGIDMLKDFDALAANKPSVKPAFTLLSFLSLFFPVSAAENSQKLPLVFSNLIILPLVILFFRNRSIPAKCKRWTAVIFGIGLLSFIFAPLNMFWHLFAEPARFIYRNAFLFVFGMILVAFYSFIRRADLATVDYLWTGGILGIGMVITDWISASQNGLFYPVLLFSAAILFLLWAQESRNFKGIFSRLPDLARPVLVIVLVAEIICLDPLTSLLPSGQKAPIHSTYTSDLSEYRSIIQSADHSSFFRAETDGQMAEPGYVRSAFADERGIASASEVSEKKLNRFLKQLGYRVSEDYQSVAHDFCILPADSMLGIRYIVSSREEMAGLQKRQSGDGTVLYENPNAAMIAVLADKDAPDFDFYSLEKEEYEKDYFAFQEGWFSSLSGKNAEGLYRECPADWEIRNGELAPCELIPVEEEGGNDVKASTRLDLENEESEPENLRHYLRGNGKSPLILRTTIKAENPDLLYLSVPFLRKNSPFTVYCNGTVVFEETSASDFSTLINLGSFREGTEVEIEIHTDEDVFSCFTPKLAYADEQVLQRQMAEIGKVKEVFAGDGAVSFRTEAAEDGFVLTSIPYEKGWKVTVDGESCEVIPYQEALVGFYVGKGNHVVKMEFTHQGGRIGGIISAVGLLSGAAVAILIKRRNKSSGGSGKK